MTHTLPVIALVVSLASFAVPFASYRQSKKTSLALRREAIHHAQAAFQDVVDGNITTKTVDSIREAAELAELLFSNNVKDPLKQAQPKRTPAVSVRSISARAISGFVPGVFHFREDARGPVLA